MKHNSPLRPINRFVTALVMSLAAAMMSGCQSDVATSQSSVEIEQKINVLFVLVDDMGWEDVGFMGSEYYSTPNIDALAANSLVFESAYSTSPNCAPTRAALMSGQYPSRTKVYTVAPKDRGPAHKRALKTPQNAAHLEGEVITLAEQFQQAGYATGFFGKWHLGRFEGESSPLAQGFDVNRGGFDKGHPKSYFSPYNNPVLEDGPKGEYLTDRLTREAIRFIDQQDASQPFFAFLSYYAVHTPLQPKPEMVPEYQSVPFESRQGHPDYAAMVENLDLNIGYITDYLKSKGMLDNTLIVFTSDNGGHSGATRMPSLRGAKGMMYEGGVRVPLFYHLPSIISAGSTKIVSSSIDHYPTLLNMAGITPLDTTLDGADLSPELVSSDNQDAITALEERKLYWHFPFYLEGTSKPGNHNAGFSRPLVMSPHAWRAEPASSIRQGNYKLIHWYQDDVVELFDLSTDLAEQNNIASSHPDITADMMNQLSQWLENMGADLPRGPNPAYRPTNNEGQ